MPLSLPNPPLLWLLHHKSWALSELQITLQPGEGCLASVHRNTQMGTHPNNVWRPCRPTVGAPSPCSITVEVLHPSEWMWYQLIPSLQCTDIAIITVLCVTLCNLAWSYLALRRPTLPPSLPVHVLERWTLWCPGAIRGHKPTCSIRFCFFPFQTSISKLMDPKVSLFSSPPSPPSFISLLQNTIDVRMCNIHFHVCGITKGHNSGFSGSRTVHLGIHS